MFGRDRSTAADADLTDRPEGEAVGQRIIVTGRLLDGAGRPIRRSLVEIWQANASGRYRHRGDQWPGTLDPNFTGGGRSLTDDDGTYRFTTVKPGAYPWGNHPNAWRPAHIHFSVFGWAFTQRLVTQMYFPDDPLFFQDPIFNSIADPAVRQRLVARYDHDVTEQQWALGFHFDIVVRGPAATPFEEADGDVSVAGLTPSQTVGPFLHLALADPALAVPVAADDPHALTARRCGRRRRGHPGARRGRRDLAVGRPVRQVRHRADRGWSVRIRRPVGVATLGGTAQAPHLVVSVFARGLLDRVVTRVYFDGDPDNAARPGAGARRPTSRARCSPGQTVDGTGASTSTCEATMSPSSSSSDPFAFLVAAGPVAALTSARAWVETMLGVEAALAAAPRRRSATCRPTRRAASPQRATSNASTSRRSSPRPHRAATS